MAGKALVIVESPAKARTLKKYLGSQYEVQASVGHIKDLPEDKLGVDLKNGFTPTYVIIEGKEKILEEISRAARKAEKIYLAPDPDREGEAIAYHIADELKKKKIQAPIFRATFHEITPSAVKKALSSPHEINMNLVEAQQARRVLDRIVGYLISPLLWKKVRRGLSAGRVQSVALRLIVEREREIQSFVPEEYWRIPVELAKVTGEGSFIAEVIRKEGEKIRITSEDEARGVVKELFALGTGTVQSVERKTHLRRPPPPFITSTLQQEAARKLGFSAKKTMLIAQELYEGVDLEEGPEGLITYMRTDSVRTAPDALEWVRDYIARRYGKEYLPEKPYLYTPRRGAQDAHEAIRPTRVEFTPERVKDHLSRDQFRLYKLIWDRFVASQMKPAEYDRTVVEIGAGPYILRASGSILKFPGFLEVYEEGRDEEEEEEDRLHLPPLSEGEVLRILEIKPQQHFTKPPPRYTEATLIKELEAKGIGRPSTYAVILSTLQEKKYVEKKDGRLHPTELGMVVNDLLVASFPGIMDVGFTAEMEAKLDQVEEGTQKAHDLLKEFYDPFARELRLAEERMTDLKREGVLTSVSCPVCGSPMRLRIGSSGEYLACSRYPSCRTTRNMVRDERGEIRILEEESTGEICPQCSAPLVRRRGRYGEFLACSRYPECKFTLKTTDRELKVVGRCPKDGGDLVLRTTRKGGRFVGCKNYPKCDYTEPYRLGIPCPRGCGGEICERQSQKGRRFFGCTNYPNCDFVLWNEPVFTPCPNCGAPFLVQKGSRGKGVTLVCVREGCGYTAPAEPVPGTSALEGS
jgi:DNA topoisomerase-1